MINLSDELLSLLHPEQKHGYAYKHIISDIVNNAENLMKKIQYYETEKTSHLEKFKRGEVDTFKLPGE